MTTLPIHLTCLVGLVLCAPLSAAQSAERKAVLAIYSKFLDRFRFAGDHYLGVMRDYLRQRYEKRHVDAVVVIGTAAAVQLALIGALFAHRSRGRHAERALRDSEATLRASSVEIQDLARRLIAEQETERKRVARELHDDVSQKLALLAMDVEQLRQDAPDFATRVRRISECVGDVATDVHHLSHQLHPFKLEALGLVAAVQGVCDDVWTQHGLAIEFRHDNVPEHLPPDVALCVFRIVQEGLRNVVKHSGAKSVWLHLAAADPDLSLQIADSGVGFVPAEHERAGLGLVSMRERVNSLGGQLAIHSAPGVGTRIGVRVPLRFGRPYGAAAPASTRHRPAEFA